MSDIPEQSLSTLFASKSDRNCIHWSSLQLPDGFCLAIKDIVRQLEMVIVKKMNQKPRPLQNQFLPNSKGGFGIQSHFTTTSRGNKCLSSRFFILPTNPPPPILTQLTIHNFVLFQHPDDRDGQFMGEVRGAPHRKNILLLQRNECSPLGSSQGRDEEELPRHGQVQVGKQLHLFRMSRAICPALALLSPIPVFLTPRAQQRYPSPP